MPLSGCTPLFCPVWEYSIRINPPTDQPFESLFLPSVMLRACDAIEYMPNEFEYLDLPELSVETFEDPIGSPVGSDVSSEQFEEISRAPNHPLPSDFKLATFFSRSQIGQSDLDIFATFDSNSGALISFSDSFSTVSDVPAEVLQSGFLWSDLHRPEFSSSGLVMAQISSSLIRINAIVKYIQSPGGRCSAFRDHMIFITAKGSLNHAVIC